MVKKRLVAWAIAGTLAVVSASGGIIACATTPDDQSSSSTAARSASASQKSDAVSDAGATQDAGHNASSDDSSGFRSSSSHKQSAYCAQSLSSSYAAHSWSYSSAPLYYTVRGKADTSPSVKKGRIKTSKLDSLGRTQRVVAKVTYKMVADSAGWRESMPAEADSISGWGKQSLVSVSLSNGKTYNGYAFNRSHLLADCLGGHAVKENLVTGTRTQNVGNNSQSEPGGMQYTEAKALNYLRAHHKGWVYYKATPVYKKGELVCRSVYVDIKSDDGSIDEHVEVYNAMRGCKVNYKTGAISGSAVKSAVKASKNSSASKGTASQSSSHKKKAKKSTSTSSTGGKWVYITNTGTKYHAAGCRYLKSKKKVTLAKAKAMGYTACKVCGG